MDLQLVAGIPAEFRDRAAGIHLAAFGEKTKRILGTDERAHAFWRAALTDDGNTLAIDGDTGQVLGLMATTDQQHRATAHQWQAARDVYGTLSAAWRVPLVALLAHRPKPGELCIEFLAVAPEARGNGVGGVLLTFAEQLAKVRGHDRVTLEVIDSNPRAKALYERSGFRVYTTRRIPPGMRWLFGFAAYDAMVRAVRPDD
jgi:ribosomal protein S18 acetylase RimI-like enzyme